jgi:hypothetical protein
MAIGALVLALLAIAQGVRWLRHYWRKASLHPSSRRRSNMPIQVGVAPGNPDLDLKVTDLRRLLLIARLLTARDSGLRRNDDEVT